MSKESAAWLAVRIFGLLILGNALLSGLEVVTRVIALVQISGMTLDDASEVLRIKQIGSLWSTVIVAFGLGLASLALAYYLLFRGAIAHRWLMRE